MFHFFATLMHSFTVDFRDLDVQGTLWNASRYPYLDISDLQNLEKKNKSNNYT